MKKMTISTSSRGTRNKEILALIPLTGIKNPAKESIRVELGLGTRPQLRNLNLLAEKNY